LTICIVYYSETGKTRRVVGYIGEGLRGRGISVRVIPVKPAREYFSRLLHLNPRILYEVLSGSPIEIVVDSTPVSVGHWLLLHQCGGELLPRQYTPS